MMATQEGFHFYGTGTSAGYQTVWCSPSIEGIKSRIEALCLSISGKPFLSNGAVETPFTAATLGNDLLLLTLWRPSSVPDFRGRKGAVEGVSYVFSFRKLQAAGMPFEAVRTALTEVHRTSPAMQSSVSLPTSMPQRLTAQDITHLRQFQSNGALRYRCNGTSSFTWLAGIETRHRNFVLTVRASEAEIAAVSSAERPPSISELYYSEMHGRERLSEQSDLANRWEFYVTELKRRQRKQIIRKALVGSSVLCVVLFIGAVYFYRSSVAKMAMRLYKTIQGTLFN